MLAASLGVAIIAGEFPAGVMVALILLGLGWSAATVAGAIGAGAPARLSVDAMAFPAL